MVETRFVSVGLHQGDRAVSLAGPTKGTKALALSSRSLSLRISLKASADGCLRTAQRHSQIVL